MPVNHRRRHHRHPLERVVSAAAGPQAAEPSQAASGVAAAPASPAASPFRAREHWQAAAWQEAQRAVEPGERPGAEGGGEAVEGGDREGRVRKHPVHRGQQPFRMRKLYVQRVFGNNAAVTDNGHTTGPGRCFDPEDHHDTPLTENLRQVKGE